MSDKERCDSLNIICEMLGGTPIRCERERGHSGPCSAEGVQWKLGWSIGGTPTLAEAAHRQGRS